MSAPSARTRSEPADVVSSTDIMVDAPLAALAFDADSSAPNVKPGRNIQVFYQTNSGGTQQVKKNGISDWSRMTE